MGVSAARSLSERYHEATVYTPATLAGAPQQLVGPPPSPFKSWHQARRIPLGGGAATQALPSAGPMTADRLGGILFHTYGVTLVREYPGMSMHYRAAPSAGGLYPAELYVAVRDLEGIPEGLHDYSAAEHALTICWEGDFWKELARYTFFAPEIADAKVVLLAAGVFQRSGWRYGDRGYRRVLLDTGHVLGNACLAAPAYGHRARILPSFHDAGLGSLLLLDDQQEGMLLVAPLVEAGLPPADPQPMLPSPRANDVDAPEEGAWTPVIHAAGAIATLEPTTPDAVAPSHPPVTELESLTLSAEGLPGGAATLQTLRERRSTRHFRPDAMPRAALGRILAYAYPPGEETQGSGPFGADVLETYVVVNRIDALQGGVYRYLPGAHELVNVREGDPHRALFDCCLRQELGRDCAFAVIHTFDLVGLAKRYGERVYRTAHLEAGVVGQALNVGAAQLGYGASGIGGFFDHFTASLLSLPDGHVVAYITTIGVPA